MAKIICTEGTVKVMEDCNWHWQDQGATFILSAGQEMEVFMNVRKNYRGNEVPVIPGVGVDGRNDGKFVVVGPCLLRVNNDPTPESVWQEEEWGTYIDQDGLKTEEMFTQGYLADGAKGPELHTIDGNAVTAAIYTKVGK